MKRALANGVYGMDSDDELLAPAACEVNLVGMDICGVGVVTHVVASAQED